MKILALTLAVVFAHSSAIAGPTMAVWADVGAGLTPDLTTQSGVQFDVVITLDSDGNSAAAAEFVITDLRYVFPGVFALATKKINDTALDLGQNDLGEYLMAFGACEPSSNRIEMVRITYADFSGVIGNQSTLVTLRGFEAGDTQYSSFNGSPGFVECNDDNTKHSAEMGGNENEGALCVNCYEPPTRDASMTDLKAKF